MELFNLAAGWIAVTLGALWGVALGAGFHRDDWLGGYDAWPRRLLRLGHTSFFGLGGLNIAAALTAQAWSLDGPSMRLASILLLGALAMMPAACLLVAFRRRALAVFGAPVLATLGGVALVAWSVAAHAGGAS